MAPVAQLLDLLLPSSLPLLPHPHPSRVRIQNVSPPRAPHVTPLSAPTASPIHLSFCAPRPPSGAPGPHLSVHQHLPPSPPQVQRSALISTSLPQHLISRLFAPSSFRCAFLASLCLPLAAESCQRCLVLCGSQCHVTFMAADLNRPSAVPGCPGFS